MRGILKKCELIADGCFGVIFFFNKGERAVARRLREPNEVDRVRDFLLEAGNFTKAKTLP